MQVENGCRHGEGITGIGAGIGYLLAGQLDATWLLLFQGLAAGAMLTMIAAAMIPEAVMMGTGNTVGLSTLAGFLGAVLVLGLVAAVVLGLLSIATRTRERFGKLVCVGVAAWFGAQSLFHVAVCGWLVPSTGLPMPLISYGGSSTLAMMLALAVCLNVGARREPILAGDGFR